MRTGLDDTEVLLTLWEGALGQPASARTDALLQASFATGAAAGRGVLKWLGVV